MSPTDQKNASTGVSADLSAQWASWGKATTQERPVTPVAEVPPVAEVAPLAEVAPVAPVKAVVPGKAVAPVEEVAEVAPVAPARPPRVRRPVKERGRSRFSFRRRSVSSVELMHFSRQLASFLRAGVPLVDGLGVIREESSSAELRALVDGVTEALQAGESLAEAVERNSRDFPPFYRAMVAAAELTGQLDDVLDQLSHYLERDLEARRKVRSALAYPALILVMSLITVGVLTVFVLPRFETFFEDFDATLPLPTRMLLAVTHFLTEWWWALGLAGAAMSAGFVAFGRTATGREVRDSLLLRLPVVGEVVRFAIVERFCRILASLVGAGVPLPQAMAVVTDATNNRVFQRHLDGAREAMLEGEGIARPIADTGLFPGSITQMMRVGEDTGTLEDQLERAAEYHDQELTYKIKHFTTLFEPAVLIFMGVVVGFVAIALVSAMYGIFRQSGRF